MVSLPNHERAALSRHQRYAHETKRPAQSPAPAFHITLNDPLTALPVLSEPAAWQALEPVPAAVPLPAWGPRCPRLA